MVTSKRYILAESASASWYRNNAAAAGTSIGPRHTFLWNFGSLVISAVGIEVVSFGPPTTRALRHEIPVEIAIGKGESAAPEVASGNGSGAVTKLQVHRPLGSSLAVELPAQALALRRFGGRETSPRTRDPPPVAW